MATDYQPPACASFRPLSFVPRPRFVVNFQQQIATINFIKITTSQSCKIVIFLLNLTNYNTANGSLTPQRTAVWGGGGGGALRQLEHPTTCALRLPTRMQKLVCQAKHI